MSDELAPRLHTAFLACFVWLVAHALAEVEYHVISSGEAVEGRLMLILLDGFRWDYLEHPDHQFPGFGKVAARGARPKYLVPDFPTLSYPNYYSLMTGVHTEEHGMTGNFMYDPATKDRFLIGTNPEQFHPHWWQHAEPLWVTAGRQNRTSYMYHWPGCEVEIQGRRPTHCQPYNGTPTMDQFREDITEGLTKLQFNEADIVAIYFELTDSLGHRYGPLSDPVMQTALDLDPIMGYLADSLPTFALSDVNLMIVSDHGMTSVSRTRVIDLRDVISPESYEAMFTEGAVSFVYTKPGLEEEVYQQLRDVHPNLTVYRRDELPDRWRYKHGPYTPPITATADLGWLILGPDKRKFPRRTEDKQPMVGWHGYDNKHLDMMALFIGMGPAFRPNTTCGPVSMVDVYQVMCQALAIQPQPNSGSWGAVADIVTFNVSSSSSTMTSPSPSVTSALFLFALCSWFTSFRCCS